MEQNGRTCTPTTDHDKDTNAIGVSEQQVPKRHKNLTDRNVGYRTVSRAGRAAPPVSHKIPRTRGAFRKARCLPEGAWGNNYLLPPNSKKISA
jgi:hypothetical protein